MGKIVPATLESDAHANTWAYPEISFLDGER